MLIGLGGVLVLADLAPIVAGRSARQAGLAAACRVALAPTCHQRPERSLHFGGIPLAACARCVGIHAGGVVGGLALLFAASARLRRGRFLVLAATLVLVLDVAAGSWSAWDLAPLRVATGILFAAAIAIAAGAALDRYEALAAPAGLART
jgi:uncharacterized membrane protein